MAPTVKEAIGGGRAQPRAKTGGTSAAEGSPAPPISTGAASATAWPSRSITACTVTSESGASGRCVSSAELLSRSKGCAVRQPSIAQERKRAKPSVLGRPDVAAAKISAAGSPYGACPLWKTLRVMRTQLPL
jgi:hypothetical protein